LDRCGPCKYIGPIFEKMAEEYPDVAFAKVDVDEAEDVSAACSIRAMPTFQFYRNGEKVDELQGADQAGLTSMILKHK
jgi:thioredoxin 1